MKILIGIITLFVLAIFLYGRKNKTDETQKNQGQLDDIEGNIKKLMTSNNAKGFLVVEVAGTEDFIQFSGDDKGVQLDFPIVTKRQKELETKFRECAKELKLKVIENKGTDGTTFLDIELNGSPSEISGIAMEIITKLFKVCGNSELNFQMDI